MSEGVDKKDRALLWFDLESTSVEPDCTILEVGAAISRDDDEMEFVWQVGRTVREHNTHPDIIRLQPDVTDYVDKMHEANGLWKDVAAGSPLMVVEHEVMLGISYALDEMGMAPDAELVMAGSGVERFDRLRIKTAMPTLDKRLPYYCTDISSMRRLTLSRLLFDDPEAQEDIRRIQSQGIHRALPDLYAHRDTLIYMTQRVRSRMTPL